MAETGNLQRGHLELEIKKLRRTELEGAGVSTVRWGRRRRPGCPDQGPGAKVQPGRGISIFEHLEVEPAQAFGVGDHVDRDDLAALQREGHNQDQAPPGAMMMPTAPSTSPSWANRARREAASAFLAAATAPPTRTSCCALQSMREY
jgi:hypothetical protein